MRSASCSAASRALIVQHGDAQRARGVYLFEEVLVEHFESALAGAGGNAGFHRAGLVVDEDLRFEV